MAEPGPPDAAEQEVGTDCATLGDPRAKHARRRAGQRRAALLTTLAVAANVGAGAEGEVVDPQPGKFRQAQAGLDGEEEQRVVAATESGCRVWRCEERVDFGGGEEGDEVTVEALLRDGEDALDQSRVRWLAAGREAEERGDRGRRRRAARRCPRGAGWKAPCRCASRRNRGVAGTRRGRRRWYAGSPSAGAGAARKRTLRARERGGSRPHLPAALQALAGEREQIGSGGEIPVRAGRTHVAEIGRERRQAALGIEAGAVPVAHGLHREGVAEVVDARAAPSVAGTGEFDQPDEDAIEVLVVDACTDT